MRIVMYVGARGAFLDHRRDCGCPMDCGICQGCGNMICEAAKGETCASCPGDCGTCIAQCSNMIDDDGDGKIDFHPLPGKGDPQCTSAADNSEAM